MRLASRAACAALLPLLAACADSPTGADGRALHIMANGVRLDLAVSVEPARIALGDSARVVASVTNRGLRTATLVFGGCHLWTIAEDERGELLPGEGSSPLCGAAVSTVRLAPGESMRRETYWTHSRTHHPPLARSYRHAGVVQFRAVLGVREDGGEYMRSGRVARLEVVDTATYGGRPEVAISRPVPRGGLQAGQMATFDVTLTNRAATATTMRFTSTCAVGIELWQQGRVVARGPDACGDAITSLTLAAGESRVVPVAVRLVDPETAGAMAAGDVLAVATLGVHRPEAVLRGIPHFVRVSP